MKFKVSKHADILWMDDFDTNSSDPIDIETEEDEDYVSEEDVEGLFPNTNRYKFRLHPFKYVKQTLDELENNFFQYSCAILDINMKEGFAFQGEENKKEYEEIKAILKKANVRIRDEHRWPDGYDTFKKNAGYYIYLYLLQKGMPSDRIVIFTGNKGKTDNSSTQIDNLTDEWEGNFKAAGLNPPKAFDKQTGQAEVSNWIEEKLNYSYRLRSCMVIMSTYVLEALEKYKTWEEINYDAFEIKDDKKKENFLEEAKLILRDLQNIPLRLPETESELRSIFKSLIDKIAHPWEATERKGIVGIPYAYCITMRTTRNWLAHDIIKDDNKSGFKNLWTMAFLFGVGMRGMFDLRVLLESDGMDKYDEYRKWENELLALIQDNYPWQKLTVSDSDAKHKVDQFRKMIIRSYNELHVRNDKFKHGVLTTDLGWLIFEMGNKGNKITCYEMDLLRNFLHGITLLYFAPPKEQKLNQLGKYEFVINVDYKTQAQYYYYLCGKDLNISHKLNTKEKDDVNTNREWDYVESIFGHIENELSRLEKKDVNNSGI